MYENEFNKRKIYHVGVSGGKDSTAVLLWMIHESGINKSQIVASFCDTQNEAAETYQHIKLLNDLVHPILTIETPALLPSQLSTECFRVAIAPVVAGEWLKPGAHVYVTNGQAYHDADDPNLIGIVDPYLSKKGVEIGEMFYLFLYPGSITSLRHDWTHPHFEAEAVTAAKKWLTSFAENRFDCDYDELMLRIGQIIDKGYIDGTSMFSGTGEIPMELYDHYGTVINRTIADNEREEYWSCSC